MSKPEPAQAETTSTSASASRPSPLEESRGNSTETPLSASDGGEETSSLLKQLTVGTIIDGKYKIDEVIGRGAMGVVVAATHIHLKERVALKFLNAKAHTQATDFHSRFRREAQVSAKLRNEHITRVIDVGVWREKVPFMVMDHLVGDDLRRVLKANGKLSLPVAIDYIVQICEGLAEAHALGIVHRDLKPSNLFVTKRPDGTELIKILDFGISKWSQQEEQLDELTQTGVVLGSPKYMAPEQLFGSASVDMRADVWSIGAMFYEMLGGRPPFDFPTLTRICAELASDKQPPSLRTANPDISEHLETVIMQCFARDRDHRIPNVAELAGQILDAVEAPFAGQVKTKIAMVLDPRSQILSTTTSSGGLPLSTGNYRSLSISGGSMTGTGPQRLSSSGAIRLALDASQGPSSGTTANGVESAITPAEAGKKRVLAIGIGVAALLALGGIFFVVSSSHGTPEASPGKGVQATAPTTTTNPVVATPPSTAASPTPSGSAPSATAADSAAAAASASAASNPPANHGGGGGGVFHPRHGGGGGGRTAPPPPPVVTAAPAPAPAPTPTPAPKPSSNPLEDRQ